MKRALVFIMGLVAIAALTACPKSKTDTPATVTAANACIYDINGCQAAGPGYWYGRLTVTNVATYKQLLAALNLCYDGGSNGYYYTTSCNMAAGFMDLSILLQQGGYLPGYANLGVSGYFSGSYYPTTQQLWTEAYPNNNNNGLQLNYTFYPNNGIINNSLTVTTVYTDAARRIMTVQAMFRGAVFATGSMTGN